MLVFLYVEIIIVYKVKLICLIYGLFGVSWIGLLVNWGLKFFSLYWFFIIGLNGGVICFVFNCLNKIKIIIIISVNINNIGKFVFVICEVI